MCWAIMHNECCVLWQGALNDTVAVPDPVCCRNNSHDERWSCCCYSNHSVPSQLPVQQAQRNEVGRGDLDHNTRQRKTLSIIMAGFTG